MPREVSLGKGQASTKGKKRLSGSMKTVTLFEEWITYNPMVGHRETGHDRRPKGSGCVHCSTGVENCKTDSMMRLRLVNLALFLIKTYR